MGSNHQRWWCPVYTSDTDYHIGVGVPTTVHIIECGRWRCDTYAGPDQYSTGSLRSNDQSEWWGTFKNITISKWSIDGSSVEINSNYTRKIFGNPKSFSPGDFVLSQLILSIIDNQLILSYRWKTFEGISVIEGGNNKCIFNKID